MSNSKETINNGLEQAMVNKELPSMYDLPSEEVGESGLPDEYHVYQSELLKYCFSTEKYDSNNYFIGTDINLYFDLNNPLWYKRPDWFVAVGVPSLYQGKDLRYSYVVWQEKVTPLIVIELLSESSRREDLGQSLRDVEQIPPKWVVYEQILQVPYYITYDRVTNEMFAFRLIAGRYQRFLPESERLFIPELDISLGFWQGKYYKFDRLWLRWFDSQGNLIPTPWEREALEKERERQEKEVALIRVEKLAAKLRELGIDLEE